MEGGGASAAIARGTSFLLRRNHGTPIRLSRGCHGTSKVGGSDPGDGTQWHDSHLIVKVPVEPQDVGVPEVGLDLDLASQLVLDVRLLQLLFEQNLEGDDVLAVLLASQVHVAELAAAQGFAYVEVAQLRGSGAGWMSARERWGGLRGCPQFRFLCIRLRRPGEPPAPETRDCIAVGSWERTVAWVSGRHVPANASPPAERAHWCSRAPPRRARRWRSPCRHRPRSLHPGPA